MGQFVRSIVEPALWIIILLILFAVVFAGLAGCYFITMAATNFVQVLQTPPPF